MADAPSDSPGIEDAYNVGLHIGALFANMAASACGVLLPIVISFAHFSPQTHTRIQAVIQTARTFGSGVILATAFIHMLPAAFSYLSDPSLPEIFQEGGYTGWAGLIAMVSALLLHLLEFAATQRFFNQEKELKKQMLAKQTRLQGNRRVHAVDRLQEMDTVEKDLDKKNRDEIDSLEEGRRASAAAVSGSDDKRDSSDLIESDPCVHMGHVHGGEMLLANKVAAGGNGAANDGHVHVDGMAVGHEAGFDPEQERLHHEQERRMRAIGTYILEFGIALHSVIIGITLGTTVGSDFVSLLIALLFHQFFEGVALGGRIAAIQFPRHSMSPWLLSAWFACSTPLGIAIGIGIRSSYDGESAKTLIIQGVFDACSSGILLYTAMVQLMSSELNANRAFRESSLKHQVTQFTALWLGSAAMAIIGKWA